MSDNGLHDIARALREIAGVLREHQVEAPKAGTASPPAAPTRPEWVRVVTDHGYPRECGMRKGAVLAVTAWRDDGAPFVAWDGSNWFALCDGEWEPCSAPSDSVVRSTQSDTPESRTPATGTPCPKCARYLVGPEVPCAACGTLPSPESPSGDMAQGTREATPDAALREAAEVVVAREREISWDEEPESLTAAIRALRAALGGAK